MKILKLDYSKKKIASRVLAAAFYNYPMFTLYFPNRNRRTRYLAWYLGKVLNCAMRFGEVNVTSDMSGIIFTLSPGHTKLSQEEEADAFARDALIPPADYQKLSLQPVSKDKIVIFANEIGIDPGIVVGRLQKDKIIAFSQYNDLKTHYQIAE